MGRLVHDHVLWVYAQLEGLRRFQDAIAEQVVGAHGALVMRVLRLDVLRPLGAVDLELDDFWVQIWGPGLTQAKIAMPLEVLAVDQLVSCLLRPGAGVDLALVLVEGAVLLKARQRLADDRSLALALLGVVVEELKRDVRRVLFVAGIKYVELEQTVGHARRDLGL